MKHSRFAYLFIILSFVHLTLFTAGCGKKETTAKKAIKGKRLLIGNGAKPSNLDYAFSIGSTDMPITHAISESLLNQDPKADKPRTGVTNHWEFFEGGLTYTFHLRKNVCFSNDGLITAEDFVFSIQRLLSSNLGSLRADYLYGMKNNP